MDKPHDNVNDILFRHKKQNYFTSHHNIDENETNTSTNAEVNRLEIAP